MQLFDAYCQAIDETDDPAERNELSANTDLKTLIIEEIDTAMQEMRARLGQDHTKTDLVKPLFDCVAFWFLIGIRVGKILRDAELAAK